MLRNGQMQFMSLTEMIDEKGRDALPLEELSNISKDETH